MLIDYTDQRIQDELIGELRTKILDYVQAQLDDLPDAVLAEIRFSDALYDITTFIDNHLIIEFNA